MSIHHAQYQLGSTANYHYDIIKIGHNEYDPMAYMHKKEFPDVEVTRPGTDTDLLRVHNTTLTTVNGYIHNTAFDAGRLYIPGATRGMLHSRANSMGLLDFGAITPLIKRVALTSTMVTEDTNQSAYDKVFITLPQAVQQPMLVMAGYLIPYNEEHFYRVSDNVFALRLVKLNYNEKLYELSRYTDIFRQLDVPTSPLNASVVDTQFVRSLNVIRRFLSLPNSFVIDLSVDNVGMKKVYLEHSKIPGTFKTQVSPSMPLVMGYGKLSEYAVTLNQQNQFTVNTQDAHLNNHLLSYMPTQRAQLLNDHRVPGNTHALSQAFFLDITSTR
jgi:hypothetical protein